MQPTAQEIIVIEGLGGAGKTTAAQNLAEKYGYSNFNTGTLFRSVAAALIQMQIASPDTADFIQEAKFVLDLSSAIQPNVAVTGLDVTDMLQTPAVTKMASFIGSLKGVAEYIESIFNLQLEGSKIVVEGKNLKGRTEVPLYRHFFLMATPEVRSFRKWKQALEKGDSWYTMSEARRDTYINDRRDSRLLAVKEGINIINTTYLSHQQVLQVMMRRIESASGGIVE